MIYWLLKVGRWIIGVAILLVVLVALHYGINYLCNCGRITLWDWLKLLIVPAVLALGGYWLNRQQNQRQLEIAERNARDDALQAYLDQMSNLLADKKRPLHRAEPGDALSTVARARTLTVLRRLDENRKGNVVQFLYESGLIMKDQPIVSLAGANLYKAFLDRAHLRGVDLRGAFLSRTLLREGDLTGADLRETDLYEALLSGTDLSGTDLSGAKLSGAKLGGTNLSETNLSGSNLGVVIFPGRGIVSEVEDLTQDQIDTANGDENTILPDHLQRPAHWKKGDKEAQGGEEGGD